MKDVFPHTSASWVWLNGLTKNGGYTSARSSLLFVAFKALAITPVLGMMTMATILMFIVPTLVAMVVIPGVMIIPLMVVVILMLGALIMLMAAPDTPLVDMTQLIGAAMLALITTGVCLIRIFNVTHHANVLPMLRRRVICFLRLFFLPIKHSLDDRTREKLEMAWLDCWRAQLGKPPCTQRTVMQAYLDEMDMTLEDLDAQMCWDCWLGDDNPFKDLELPDSE